MKGETRIGGKDAQCPTPFLEGHTLIGFPAATGAKRAR